MKGMALTILCLLLTLTESNAAVIGYSTEVTLSEVTNGYSSTVLYSETASSVSGSVIHATDLEDYLDDGYVYSPDGFDVVRAYGAAYATGNKLGTLAQLWQDPWAAKYWCSWDYCGRPLDHYQLTASATFTDTYTVSRNVDRIRLDFSLDGQIALSQNYGASFTLQAYAPNGVFIETTSYPVFSWASNSLFSIGAGSDPVFVDEIISVYLAFDPFDPLQKYGELTSELTIKATSTAWYGSSDFSNTLTLRKVTPLLGTDEATGVTVASELLGDMGPYMGVPEPSSVLLILSGALGLLATRTRHRLRLKDQNSLAQVHIS